MGHHSGGFQAQPQRSQFVHGKVGIEQLLKLQIAGKMAAPVPMAELKAQLKYVQTHPRPNLKPMKGKGTFAYAADDDYGYVLDFSKKFKKVTGDYDVEDNGCYYPTTVKVDHSGNVWNSCEYDSYFQSGQAQEYNSSGTLLNNYDAKTCPSNESGCEDVYGYSFDFGENGSQVVVALPYGEFYNCPTPSTCAYVYVSGFDVFQQSNPTAAPYFINVYEGNNTPGLYIYDVGYMDADANNIYFEYYGEDTTTDTFGYGLAEITNFTSSSGWGFTDLVPPGTIGFWGGTEVNKADTRLSTVDQDARTDTVSSLPFTSLGTVYGPTLQNAEGFGDPISGGWNAAETSFVAGDGYGWLDTISSSNTAKIVNTDDCPYGCYGASYAASDHQ